MNQPVPDLQPASFVTEIGRGLRLPLSAFKLIFAVPRLRALALVCAGVTGLTLVGIAVGSWSAGHGLSTWMLGGDAASDGWRSYAAVGVGVLLAALFFGFGALTLPNLLLAPLQDPLSEATEVVCGDFTPEPFSMSALVRGTWESLRHTLLRLLIMTVGAVVLLPLHLVPVVGNVLSFALTTAWSMYWLAVEHLSNPMARHLRRFREVVTVLRRRLLLALGFGATLWVLLWIPVVNFFLMPVAVVAGTLLYRGLRQAGALPESQ